MSSGIIKQAVEAPRITISSTLQAKLDRMALLQRLNQLDDSNRKPWVEWTKLRNEVVPLLYPALVSIFAANVLHIEVDEDQNNYLEVKRLEKHAIIIVYVTEHEDAPVPQSASELYADRAPEAEKAAAKAKVYEAISSGSTIHELIETEGPIMTSLLLRSVHQLVAESKLAFTAQGLKCVQHQPALIHARTSTVN